MIDTEVRLSVRICCPTLTTGFITKVVGLTVGSLKAR